MPAINRRQALTLSAASLGLMALAGTAPAADAPAKKARRPLKKAFFGLPSGGATLTDRCRILKEAGFDGVQLNLPDTKLPVEDLKKAFDETGLKFEGACDSKHWSLHLSSPDASIRQKGLEFLQEALRITKTLGGGAVLLVPGVCNEQTSYDDAYKRSQDEIRKAIPLATELGIKIAVENVWNGFHLSPIEAARYVDELESPSVGWYFDIGNVMHFGFPEQWIRILGKRIVRIHVKEYDRKKSDKEGKWAGFKTDLLEGSNNWTAIMKAFDDIGYNTAEHWATIEMAGGGADRMKVLSEKLDKILES